MYRTIVFAYDGSTECRDALRNAFDLGATGATRCHLLAVVRPPLLALASGSAVPEEMLEEERARLQAVLDGGVAGMQQAGLQAGGTVVFGDAPSKAISGFATQVQADLVVVGHQRRSTVKRWWQGSVGHSLLDLLPCSLLVSMPRADGAA